jgi:hypothetical protein
LARALIEERAMSISKLTINRAPVMTLWATVVAERLGFDHDDALTLAKVVTGLNAQAKGRRLGIYEPAPMKERMQKLRGQPDGTAFSVELMGRAVPVVATAGGVRATQDGKPVEPAAVERYLASKFGDGLADARAAMQELAAAFDEDQLADSAYHLYEKFRPVIPAGVKGWGAAGELDLAAIRSLAPAQ